MIYYYFGSKEDLYLAVLEKAYAEIRAIERDVRIDEVPPVVARPPAGRGDLRPPHDA